MQFGKKFVGWNIERILLQKAANNAALSVELSKAVATADKRAARVVIRTHNIDGAVLCCSVTPASSTMLKLPPPIWALIYLLLCVALSWSLGWPSLPGLPLPLPGLTLIALSFIPAVWAFVLFRRERTEIEPTSPSNRQLVISGPYQFTRNPMYLGLVALALGIAVRIGAWPMFIAPAAVFATANWVHIPFEEAKMRRQFGAAYDDYVARVRRWV